MYDNNTDPRFAPGPRITGADAARQAGEYSAHTSERAEVKRLKESLWEIKNAAVDNSVSYEDLVSRIVYECGNHGL